MGLLFLENRGNGNAEMHIKDNYKCAV